ncbi:MAG: hypothetical protein GTN97_05545 [Nitrosopumilaceae archaeon]|nr:hypothetical protein [Nitrosopumilaceae archaeon]
MFVFLKPKPSDATKFYVTDIDEYMKLSGSTLKTLEKLWEYSLPESIVTRLKKHFPFNSMTSKDVGICIDEFKKFVAIMLIGKKEKKGVAMTSNVIDEIWHEFVLFTIDYHDFSAMLGLEYIHHTPNTKTFSFGRDAAEFFFETYKKYFGDLHPIWYYTMIDEEISESTNPGNSKSISALLYKGKIEQMEDIQYSVKHLLVKKNKTGSGIGAPVGSLKEATSNSSCGGFFYCGTYTSGYGGSETAVSEAGLDGGAGFGSDGGDGGGCGGCGGCGG